MLKLVPLKLVSLKLVSLKLVSLKLVSFKPNTKGSHYFTQSMPNSLLG